MTPHSGLRMLLHAPSPCAVSNGETAQLLLLIRGVGLARVDLLQECRCLLVHTPCKPATLQVVGLGHAKLSQQVVQVDLALDVVDGEHVRADADALEALARGAIQLRRIARALNHLTEYTSIHTEYNANIPGIHTEY